ncbi:ABC transporter ATP-binding protein [Pseudotabrizicola algicola]|uniref:ATP-binding cassette domain-containing protein n=1 Tax=Pseudotabrizicola algicola TaxID=2709381 RepID=A0A6B3RRL6_9RHOB|nr:ATP-binding cassette domain-containing protein [Pseudotabrizicola algicola]NEX47943.1 ATP-binding cassette domain-containing protein [Pseudotabrizicola algicola]
MSPPLSLTLHGAAHGAVQILGALSFSVAPRETVAITGASGAGKTTLLRIIAGLHRGWSGELRLQGRLAMVFQEPVLLPWRTALQNICLATGASLAEGEAALASVDLAAKSGAYPDQLSLGQQRRLSLARAFATKPDVLLLDEAFVSLDAALADEIMSLFERLRDRHDVATVLVTHDAAEAARLATRIVVLSGQPARIVTG